MMELNDIIRHNHDVTDHALHELESRCERVVVRKGEAIVEQGVRSHCLFFVAEGWFRVSFDHDDVDDTICFGTEGDPFMSLHSYYAKEPSQFSCVAMQQSVVYRIPFSDLDELMLKYPDLLMWMKNVMTEQLYAFELRYIYFSTRDAYSRFVNFVGTRPEIMDIIPAKYIAQYLNLRPETLYRMRARFLRQGR